MPVLANQRHEAFAQGLAKGIHQLDAYEAAGYPRNPSSCSQMKNNPSVRARVDELVAENAARLKTTFDSVASADVTTGEIDLDWIIRTLKENIKIAQTERQVSAANKALEMIAQIYGFIGKNAAPPAEPGKPAEAKKPVDPKELLKTLAQMSIGAEDEEAGE